MAIGERIHFFRTMRGMTQKYLGLAVGFPERSADVRLAQYETGTRTPKADLTSLMHTLFTLEDLYGLTVSDADGELCLRVDKDKGKSAYELLQMLSAWQEQAAKLAAGEITKEDYDRWRYHYPKYDTTQIRTRVPSKGFSDAFLKALSEEPDE